MKRHAVSVWWSNLLGAAALGALVAAGPALAQDKWPSKSVRFLVGFAAGGTTDMKARLVAQGLTDYLGRTVIVENRPGASGNIATGELVRAAPDGYTFLVAPSTIETANPLLLKAPFHPAKDLTPVASIGRTPQYLVGGPAFGARNVKELVALAKARPGKLTYATPGVGTTPHLVSELFDRQAGILTTHVPHRGGPAALADVVAGQIDFTFATGAVVPQIRAGKVHLLGVTGARRSPLFPDTPTLGEQGVGGMEIEGWWGLWAPNGTPPAILARLNELLAKVLAQAELRQRFADIGAEPTLLGAPAFRKLLHDEATLLSALIRDRGIKVD
jgi:tripartite-type tricarboxylate transporter receptor subunit TctC